MKVKYNEVMDWEPAVFSITCKAPRPTAASEIEAYWKRWLKIRASRGMCSCLDKYLNVTASNPKKVNVACEFMCDRCLSFLVADLQHELPWISAMEVGHRSEPSAASPQAFIGVPAKNIMLEDNSTVRVQAFEISREPVSIGEFESFVASTGYVTTAEKRDDTESFRENFSLSIYSAKQRQRMAATVLSYLDAIEYCKWAGVHLASEVEIMAAATVDEGLYDDVTDEMGQRWKYCYDRGLIIGHGCKLTSSIVSAGFMVVRCGPFPFLLKDWKQTVDRHRLIKPFDFYDIQTEFHVCK